MQVNDNFNKQAGKKWIRLTAALIVVCPSAVVIGNVRRAMRHGQRWQQTTCGLVFGR
jgi:hypothetical protein